MLVILNHARPLEGNFQLNYDLRKDQSNPKANNSITNNSNNNINSTKDSVSLKKCLSSNIKNYNTLNSTEIFNNNNTDDSLPYTEELSDINFAREQNESLKKEKFELEEFYKNVLLKLNEDEKRREEEMRLHIMKMN